MVRNGINDDSSDKSWQFTERADLQGFFVPSSPISNSVSPPPNHTISRKSVGSINSTGYLAYSPSTVGTGNPSAPAKTHSTFSNMSPLSSSGTQRLSLNPFKNKQRLQEAADREQRLQAEKIRAENKQIEEKRGYEIQIRRQAEQHDAQLKGILRREEEERQRSEQEERQRIENERKHLAMIQAEQQKKEAGELVLRRREEAQRAEQRRSSQIQKERQLRAQMEEERKRKLNTPEALKELRELIRQRYELDHEIWRLRDVRASDQEVVEEKMEKADALLSEILAIVGNGAWRVLDKGRVEIGRRCEGEVGRGAKEVVEVGAALG